MIPDFTGIVWKHDSVGGNPRRVLRAALAVLAERGRAQTEEGGRRRAVAIDSALRADRV